MGWGKVQIVVQKGLLNFFVANYFSPHPLPLFTEKAETATCFSTCESQPLAREIHRLLRVPKDNHIFEYSWNVVWWQNTTRVSLKNPGGGVRTPWTIPLDTPLLWCPLISFLQHSVIRTHQLLTIDARSKLATKRGLRRQRRHPPYTPGVIFRVGIKLPRALRGCFVEVSHDYFQLST